MFFLIRRVFYASNLHPSMPCFFFDHTVSQIHLASSPKKPPIQVFYWFHYGFRIILHAVFQSFKTPTQDSHQQSQFNATVRSKTALVCSQTLQAVNFASTHSLYLPTTCTSLLDRMIARANYEASCSPADWPLWHGPHY